jgi:hypothetical protein
MTIMVSANNAIYLSCPQENRPYRGILAVSENGESIKNGLNDIINIRLS